MYGGGQQPPAASGQQSAFSHPPHFISPGPGGPMLNSRPGSHYGTPTPFYGSPVTNSHAAFMARHGSMGGMNQWGNSPHAGEQGGEDDDDDEDDDDEEDEEDDEEDEDEEEEDQLAETSSSKKRKRDSTASKNTKAQQKNGKGAAAGKGKAGQAGGPDAKKPKPTRGAKACKNCRRLKMRCVGAENGPPCDRCKNTNHECIFEESNRGKKSGKYQRTEAMAASLRKMEATMSSLIQSLKDPSKAFSASAGIMTRSPTPEGGVIPGGSSKHLDDRAQWGAASDDRERLRRGWKATDEADELGRVYNLDPSAQHLGRQPSAGPSSESLAQGMQIGQSIRGAFARKAETGTRDDHALLASRSQPDLVVGSSTHDSRQQSEPKTNADGTTVKGARFVEPDLPQRKHRASSPRLHSLPDNTLNPLGLLAEASLHNHHRSRRLSRNRQEDPIRTALRAAADATSNTSASPASAATSATKNTAVGESPSVKVEGMEDADGSSPNKQRSDAAPASIASDGRASSARSEPGREKVETPKVGVASETYFKPGPMTILPLRKIVIERELAPDLLTQGIVTSEEVLELFQVFFHNCSQHVVLFDPDWHTPTMVCGRSPFLFTVICTIASKYYTKRPDLHQQCLEVVRKCAYVVMSRGFKSVEIVQGFLLLSVWQTPSQRFEEDKTWLFSGVAIRMATDLNLHRKSMASIPNTTDSEDPAVLDREREIINRERTWLFCFCVDRSISSQMGKPWTIREDWIIRNSRHWGMQRLSKLYDMGLSALVELLRISTRQFDFLFSSTTTVSGLNTEIDYNTTLRIFNEQLNEWHDLWQARGFFTTPYSQEKEIDHSLRPVSREERKLAERLRNADLSEAPSIDADHDRRTMHFITKQAPLRYNYAVLLLNSFGLQHAMDFPKRSGMDKGIYLSKCLEAAKNVVHAACEGMRPVLSYAPDTHFIILAYACVFLLKLTRPAFSAFVDEDEIINIVTTCADTLEEVSMDPTHMPMLYATFLRALLQSRQERSTRSGATTPYKSGAASPIDSTGQDDAPGSSNGPNPENIANSLQGVSNSQDIQNADQAFINGQSIHSNPALRAGLTSDQAAMLTGDGTVNAALPGDHIDQLLNESFWSTLLPPGFGGPLDGLANGMVEMYPTTNQGDGNQRSNSAIASMLGGNGHNGELGQSPRVHQHPSHSQGGGLSAQQTRANTPVMVSSFGPGISFDFSSSGV